MNAIVLLATTFRTAIPRRPIAALPAPRPSLRERDFGIGYGRSSGYATSRSYAANWAPPRFRFA